MKRSRAWPVAVVLLALAVFVPKVWLAGSAFYTVTLSPLRLLVAVGIAKLASLVTGAVLAGLVARASGAGNPARRAWGLLALGLSGFSLGQAGLMAYQLVLGREAPLPSIGDAGFLAGYGAMILALVGFVRAHMASGLPVGRPRGHVLFAGVAALVLVAVGAPLLMPIASAPAPPAERALNMAYPVLDLVALVPCVVLVRMAWKLRGGQIARVWTSLLAGFGAMAAGDILFAYFSSIQAKRLEPLVDLTLFLGYFFVAWGAGRQRELSA